MFCNVNYVSEKLFSTVLGLALYIYASGFEDFISFMPL